MTDINKKPNQNSGDKEARKRQMRKVYMRRRIIALAVLALIVFLGYKAVRSIFKDVTVGSNEYVINHELTGANNNQKNQTNSDNSSAMKTTNEITSAGKKINLNDKSLSSILSGNKVTEELRLINADNLLPDNYKANLILFSDNVYVAPPVKPAFQEMLNDTLNETGDMIYIISGFRNRSKQTQLNQKDEVYTQVPGGSEHESGLAIDIMVDDIGDVRFFDTPSGKFTNENSWKYGFIVRYGRTKQEITNIPFEPWHFRYVGLPHAQIMYENDFAMEEYIAKLKEWEFFTYGDYIISMQPKNSNNTYKVPSGFKTDSVSESIDGYYIFTFSKNTI
ncbi:MAG: M15 family metallopeptidase [Clostridiaceae bacterium]